MPHRLSFAESTNLRPPAREPGRSWDELRNIPVRNRVSDEKFQFVVGAGREEALKKVQDIISKTNNLIPNTFAKSGLEDLHKRAFEAVEAAKREAGKQLEEPVAE